MTVPDPYPTADPAAAPRPSARRTGLIVAGVLMVLSVPGSLLATIHLTLLLTNSGPGLGAASSVASVTSVILFILALVFAALGLPGAPGVAGRGRGSTLPKVALLAYALVSLVEEVLIRVLPMVMSQIGISTGAVQGMVGAVALLALVLLIVATIGVIVTRPVTGLARWSLLVPIAGLLLTALTSAIPELSIYITAQFVGVAAWLVVGISWLVARPAVPSHPKL